MCGLIFTDTHIQNARKNKKRTPHQAAWEQLLSSSRAGDAWQQVQWDAWRYQFNADLRAGEQGILTFQNLPLPDHLPTLFIALQAYAMLQSHPAFQPSDWLTQCRQQLDQQDAPSDIVDHLWYAVIQTAIGVITSDDTCIQYGVDTLKHTVDKSIHPEGYLPAAVKTGPESVALQRQIQSVQALILIAEMCEHIGINLWQYNNRGVSIMTAATYPLYYYFYPEKWQWNGEEWKPSDGIDEATAKRIFQTHAGFLELVRRHYTPPLKAIQMMLDDLRPIYDPFCGGFVTLSHAEAKRRMLFI